MKKTSWQQKVKLFSLTLQEKTDQQIKFYVLLRLCWFSVIKGAKKKKVSPFIGGQERFYVAESPPPSQNDALASPEAAAVSRMSWFWQQKDGPFHFH